VGEQVRANERAGDLDLDALVLLECSYNLAQPLGRVAGEREPPFRALRRSPDERRRRVVARDRLREQVEVVRYS